MSRRVPYQQLRGSDPATVEVMVQDMLRRPMGQLEPRNLLDLVAISELEQPLSFRTALNELVKRTKQEIRDLPNGQVWRAWLAEFEPLEPRHIPLTFRQMLIAETERQERETERLKELLEDWALEEPEPFQFATSGPRPKVTTIQAVDAEPEPVRPAAAARSAGPKAAPARRSELSQMDDTLRMTIREVCLDRIRQSTEKGLGEQVLVAGVRHRLREKYPKLTPQQVVAVLKELKEDGVLRGSAGRWSFVRV
jgi:hypothetical protein